MDGVTIRLTDAHVAAIADSVNEGRVVVALAKEVREARQRRCDRCAHAMPNPPAQVTAPWEALTCHFHSDDGDSWSVAVDYFCADFASKSELATLDSRATADGH